MRQITVYLYQNNGTTTPGNSISWVSSEIADLADFSASVDGKNNLTKISPGEVTLKVLDPTGSVWTFLSTQLQLIPTITLWENRTLYQAGAIVAANGGTYICLNTGYSAPTGLGPAGTGTSIYDGSTSWNFYTQNSGLLAPWLECYVGGTRVFMGNVDPTKVIQNQSSDDYSIEIGAVDWSLALANAYLGTPQGNPWLPNYSYQAGQYCLSGGSSYICVQTGTSAASGGPSGVGSAIADNTCAWTFVAPTWQRQVPPLALASSSSSSVAQSLDVSSYLDRGQYLTSIWITNPCVWITPGTTLTMSHPVLNIVVPGYGMTVDPNFPGSSHNNLPPLSVGSTGIDGAGQTWTVYLVREAQNGQGNGQTAILGWELTTPCVDPATDPSMALPQPGRFSPGLIVGFNGVQWQVTPDGNHWTNTIDWSYLSPYCNVTQVIPNNSIYPANNSGGVLFPGMAEIILDSQPWPLATYTSMDGYWTSTFTQYGATLQDVSYWTTSVDVPANTNNQYWLDFSTSVNGIRPGDKLSLIDSVKSGSWTVAGVDPIMFRVNTIETVSDVPIGSHIYFDAASQEEMVLQDPKTIMAQLVYPFGLDTTYFTSPVTQDPVFGYLPESVDAIDVGDIEATKTGLRTSQAAFWIDPTKNPIQYMSCKSWTGSPDEGWTLQGSAPYGPQADWTSQLLTAPATLMPYEVAGLNPYQKLRNRVYNDPNYEQKNNGIIIVNNMPVNGAYVQTLASGAYQYVTGGVDLSTANGNNFTPWSPSWAVNAGNLTIYDYSVMKRYSFLGSALAVHPWNVVGWSAPINYTWPSGNYVQSAAPMIGHAGSILAYTTDANRTAWLELWNLLGGLQNTTPCAVPATLINGTLTTTPYGTYLVGPTSIGQVTFANGVLTIALQYLVDSVTYLYANTLVARTAEDFIIFGRYDSTTDSTTTTQTWLFRLNTNLAAGLDTSVILSEMIQEGCPSVMGCTRDPSKAGRIVGHCSGAIWQYDTVVPLCLERFKPGGMTAITMLEHIMQYFSCIATPDANGIMHIISRVSDQPVLNLTVPKISVKRTLNWPEFASITRITSQDGSFYGDAFGLLGGIFLEITDHPLCWSFSSCLAMAQGLSAYFGVPRQVSEETWFWPDANTAAPWESIPLFSKVSINGANPVRILYMSNNLATGECSVKTLGV